MLWLFAIFSGFVALGVFIYRNYLLRKRFFDSLLSFCSHLEIEINFSKSIIPQVIERYSHGYCKNFRAMLAGYSDLINTKQDISKENLNQLLWNKLKSHEKANVLDFLYELGRHGSSEENQKIQAKMVTFKKFHKLSETALAKDASIYLKICIIVGIASVILLV